MASSFVRFNHTRQSTRTAKHDPTTTFPRRYANTASLWRARNWRPSSPGHVHRTGSEEQLTPIKACRSHLFGRQGKRTKRLAAALIRVVSVQKGVDGAVTRRVPDRLLVGRLESWMFNSSPAPAALAKRSSRALSSATVIFSRIRPPFGFGSNAARPPWS